MVLLLTLVIHEGWLVHHMDGEVGIPKRSVVGGLCAAATQVRHR